MTDDRMALVDLLQKSGDGDFLRTVAEAVLHERTGDRLNLPQRLPRPQPRYAAWIAPAAHP